ncbi:MAG: ribonuclease HI family protein [Candidatus Neomarinimicrobiota bacterium]
MLRLNDLETQALLKILKNKKLQLLMQELDASERTTLDLLIRRLSEPRAVSIYVDGAADLQNEIAGIGVVMFAGDDEISRHAGYIGQATNNEAEYRSLIKGLELAAEQGFAAVNVFMDSELVVRQINGQYQVKNERMKPLYRQATTLLQKFDSWSVKHVPRTENKIADQLSKTGMSEGKI